MTRYQYLINIITLIFVNNFASAATLISNTQAWIYPGPPACHAKQEYSDGRSIQTLKPEYFTVDEFGNINLLEETTVGCNGYSLANVTSVKANSRFQFVTVSADAIAMAALTNTTTSRSNGITKLVKFIKNTGFTGVELDFEGFSDWSASQYTNFKQFILELGNALHGINAQLMIDGPPISNLVEQSYYLWRYEDFNSLPVDYIVVMAYDYQYDYGVGNSIAPSVWVTNIINYTKSKILDINKIVVGIPSYGYHGITNSYRIKIDTYAQTKTYPGFSTAKQDPSSFEYYWRYGNSTYFYQSTPSLDQKRALVESLGIKNVSVWHLGGNNWFSH